MAKPLFVYSERPLFGTLVLVSLTISIVSGLLGVSYPSTPLTNAAEYLTFLFGVLTVLTLVFLLASRKFEFYSNSMMFQDGFLHTSQIPYSSIQSCTPVYGMPFFFSTRESETDMFHGRVSVMVLKVLFRKEALTIRANPMNPNLGVDLYAFVNQRMREKKNCASLNPSPLEM